MERHEVFEINDVDTLHIVNDPLRMRLLHLLGGEARSVRDLAQALDLPTTRLYYHINMLEKRGLIGVAETRKVGAMTERRYQTVAVNYQPGAGLIESINDSREAAELAVGTILDGARLDAEAALERHFASGGGERAGLGTLARTFVQLTAEQFEEWHTRLTDLIQELDRETAGNADNDDAEIYGLTVVFAKSVGPIKGGRR